MPIPYSLCGPRRDELETRRRRRCRWLGVVLLVGFFLPILDAGAKDWARSIWEYDKRGSGEVQTAPSMKVVFFLPTVVISGRASPLESLIVFYPLLAGLAALVIAGLPWKARAETMIGLGLPPFLFLAGFGVFLGGMALYFVGLWFLLIAGLAGISIGSLARTNRPASRAAHGIAVVGTVLTFLAFLLPVVPPKDGWGVIALPFKLLAEERSESTCEGLAVLLIMCCLVAAGLVCLVNRRRLEPQLSIALARRAWRLVVAGILLMFLLLPPVALVVLARERTGAFALLVVSIFTILVKACLLIFGPILLALFGAADLVVGEPEASPGVNPA
jgi:hypothetical protein